MISNRVKNKKSKRIELKDEIQLKEKMSNIIKNKIQDMSNDCMNCV